MYVRLLILWGCWMMLSGLAWPAYAQVSGTESGVAVPTAPGLASPPLPPAATTPKAPNLALRRVVRSRVLKLDTDPASRAVVRRYHLPATVADSLTALRSVRELVLALQADAYLLASADRLHWGRDTVRAQVYVGEQFHWAYLRNGNLGDGLLTRAGYREKFFRRAPWRPGRGVRLYSDCRH